ncbi:MAG: hypothetical protein KDK02_00305 [Rhodobacteraceae bacterium]|nr:hypothetical protein [Paracoccaceae bacterium]
MIRTIAPAISDRATIRTGKTDIAARAGLAFRAGAWPGPPIMARPGASIRQMETAR